jgi:hypothetical protein
MLSMNIQMNKRLFGHYISIGFQGILHSSIMNYADSLVEKKSCQGVSILATNIL